VRKRKVDAQCAIEVLRISLNIGIRIQTVSRGEPVVNPGKACVWAEGVCKAELTVKDEPLPGSGYGTSRVAVTSPLALVLQIVEIVALPATQAQLGTPPHVAGRALQT
jgi:hypothetical protein